MCSLRLTSYSIISRVSTHLNDPVSNTRLLFLSVKCKNKKSKTPTLNKISVFSYLIAATLFFSGEKNRKIIKKKVSPTYRPFFFSMLMETQLFFTHNQLRIIERKGSVIHKRKYQTTPINLTLDPLWSG